MIAKKNKIYTLTLSGVFAALITIFTAYIGHIPVGVNGGYIHFGDGLIYLAATILPLPYAMLAGAILHWTGLFAFPIWHCLIVSALMHGTGVLGDLFESLWKRSTGIKDSGNIIPGHGGLMDRFDSALFAIPTGFIYLLIFNLV